MQINTMRDAFLSSLHEEMKDNTKIFFLTADFGAPILDKIRTDFTSRFINVGIAEQNLINVAVGLALEGFTVYVYAIAPFITMRCLEQIRVNISILSQLRQMNINIIGVGAGVSYAMSGPTHHCLEDLSIMNTLPNVEIFSPSDYILAQEYVKRTIDNNNPKYIRFDAKPINYIECSDYNFKKGYRILKKSTSKKAYICTGYMSQKILKESKNKDITIVDIFFINTFDIDSLRYELNHINEICTCEEGFIGAGGFDAIMNNTFKDKEVKNMGFEKQYTFNVGSREFIHNKNNL